MEISKFINTQKIKTGYMQQSSRSFNRGSLGKRASTASSQKKRVRFTQGCKNISISVNLLSSLSGSRRTHQKHTHPILDNQPQLSLGNIHKTNTTTTYWGKK